MTFRMLYPDTDKAIRAFSGRNNTQLRQRLRRELLAGADPRLLRPCLALTATGEAKFDALAAAWDRDNRLVAHP